MTRLIKFGSIIFAFICIIGLQTAFAGKSSVEINVPDSVPKGTQVTIRLSISHNGNNIFHHTNWVYVKINDVEVKKWTFGMFSRPENNNFVRELKYVANENLEIVAEANCNLHGSVGPARALVTVH